MTKIGSTTAAIQAILAVAVLLGVGLTAEQLAGIMAAINGLVLCAAAWASPAVPWFGNTEAEPNG